LGVRWNPSRSRSNALATAQVLLNESPIPNKINSGKTRNRRRQPSPSANAATAYMRGGPAAANINQGATDSTQLWEKLIGNVNNTTKSISA
jgi:hypothetical protein